MVDARILIADDQAAILDALEVVLDGEPWAVTRASSPDEVLAAVADQDFDLALIDLNYSRDTTSGLEGLELLSRILADAPKLPVVVMTAWTSVEGVVEAMRRGARDFIEKPWKNARLLGVLRAQLELGRANDRSQRLVELEQRRSDRAPGMVASAPSMAPVLEIVERVGPSTANILITGEHGTGKEVLARHLHRVSARANEPMVIVNAGGLADGVFESELFGHVKGAFTDAKADRTGCFGLAHQGTLFLDEIGNMPLAQQAKLLRALQTGEIRPVGSSRARLVDVRVIAATNVDLSDAVQQGTFREDLLYRLNTIRVHLPPLRERTEDIAELARRCFERCSQRYGRALEGFSDAARDAMHKHSWPGNIRELEHAVERGVLMAKGARIDTVDLGLEGAARGNEATLEGMTLDEIEKHFLVQALQRADGNASAAAESLGLSRAAFYRRLARHGLRGE